MPGCQRNSTLIRPPGCCLNARSPVFTLSWWTSCCKLECDSTEVRCLPLSCLPLQISSEIQDTYYINRGGVGTRYCTTTNSQIRDQRTIHPCEAPYIWPMTCACPPLFPTVRYKLNGQDRRIHLRSSFFRMWVVASLKTFPAASQITFFNPFLTVLGTF
jgi:hypothetical protein